MASYMGEVVCEDILLELKDIIYLHIRPQDSSFHYRCGPAQDLSP